MTTKNDVSPVLYLLIRNDLPSMNAGKAMAQASHASNAFVFSQLKRWASEPMKAGWNKFLMFVGLKKFANDDFLKWVHSTDQGFGTVLVLAVDEKQMRSTVDAADKMGFVSGIVNDPTYPIQIPPELGKELLEVNELTGYQVGENHNYVTIPLDTCAYVFGEKNDFMLSAIVGRFPLHP